jgi:hypothetical protein
MEARNRDRTQKSRACDIYLKNLARNLAVFLAPMRPMRYSPIKLSRYQFPPLENELQFVFPNVRVHATGWGAFGMLTITGDIQNAPKPQCCSPTPRPKCFCDGSTVAGELVAADAERDVRGFALKFYRGEGNWDLVCNTTPVSSSAIPTHSLTSSTPRNAIPRPICARRPRCGISGHRRRRACIRSRS